MDRELILWGLGLVIGAFVSGGALTRWLLRGQRAVLLEDLRKEFVTVETLNGATKRVDDCFAKMGREIKGATGAAELAVEIAEKALTLGERVDQAQDHQWERTLAEVITPVQAILAEQTEQGKAVAGAKKDIEHLTKQVDRILERMEK